MSDGFMGRFVDWISQRRIIEESEKRIAGKSRRRARLEQYAMTSAEAGDRALDPVTPLRSGSGEIVSALLHRESICASLLALGSSVEALADDEALRDELARALPRSVTVERLCELVQEPSNLDKLDGDPPVRMTDAQSLATAARALLELTRGAERQLQKASTRRFLRIGVTGLLLTLSIAFGAEAASRIAKGPNLAEGRPWRASSAYDGFSAEAGICDGGKTRIFFHTTRELEPWVELDLGEPTVIRRVDVRNRRDCCRDRSYPLAIEGSVDAQTWQELGRQTEPFSEWTLKFQATEVRYVRAKALKRTFLHLESLEVR